MGIAPVFQYAAVAAAMRFAMDETASLAPEEILTQISGLDQASEEYRAIMEFVPLAGEADALSKMSAKALKMLGVQY